MVAFEILEAICNEISAANIDIPVKQTPDALYAPQGYSLLTSESIVLVWLDSISYNSQRLFTEVGHHLIPPQYKRIYRYVFSIGHRTMAELPRLDELCEKVENIIVSAQIPGIAKNDLTFVPLSLSRVSVNSDVYWRQFYAEAYYTVKI